VTVAVLGGAVILFPSLALLFRLVLGGTLDPHAARAVTMPSPAALLTVSKAGCAARVAGAAFIAAIGFLTLADAPWAHALGVVSLLVFTLAGFIALTPAQTATKPDATPEP
jgi:cytochrome bd ubiquinol oxidase subunit II